MPASWELGTFLIVCLLGIKQFFLSSSSQSIGQFIFPFWLQLSNCLPKINLWFPVCIGIYFIIILEFHAVFWHDSPLIVKSKILITSHPIFSSVHEFITYLRLCAHYEDLHVLQVWRLQPLYWAGLLWGRYCFSGWGWLLATSHSNTEETYTKNWWVHSPVFYIHSCVLVLICCIIVSTEGADSCSLRCVCFLKHNEVLTGNLRGQMKVWDLKNAVDKPAFTFMLSGEQVCV